MDEIELVKRNTEEVVTLDEMKSLIDRGFSFYLGIAPTGPLHIGYFAPVAKFIDLIKVGGNAKFLTADYHAYLDDRKTPWEEMNLRAEYIEKGIKILLGKYASKVEFYRGSDFQTEKEYIEDLFKAASLVTTKRALRAASEVIRVKESPLVSSLMYPLMQILDVKYLAADVALGGIDQRHIYMLGREILPELGWKKNVSIFTPLLTSLKGPGVKMSASKPETTITIHNTKEEIYNKIRKAYCPAKDVEHNPVLDIAVKIIIPILGSIEVENRDKGVKKYENVEELKKDYAEDYVWPQHLKNAVAESLEELIAPIREEFAKDSDFLKEVSKSFEKSGYKLR